GRARAGAFARVAVRAVSFAHDRGPKLPKFSVGHPPFGNRVSRALLRANGLADAPRRRRVNVTRRIVSPQAASLQTHAHVRRGETDERRRLVVEPHRARFPLLESAVADGAGLVVRSTSGVV